MHTLFPLCYKPRDIVIWWSIMNTIIMHLFSTLYLCHSVDWTVFPTWPLYSGISANNLATEKFDIVSVRKPWLAFWCCVLAQLQISANSKLIVNWRFYGCIQIEIWAKVQTRRSTHIVSMLWRKIEIKEIFAGNSLWRSGRIEIRKTEMFNWHSGNLEELELQGTCTSVYLLVATYITLLSDQVCFILFSYGVLYAPIVAAIFCFYEASMICNHPSCYCLNIQ